MALRAHLDLAALAAGAVSASHPEDDDHAEPNARALSGSGNWGYTSPGGRRFALTGTSAGLSIVEVTNPDAARVTGLIAGPASPWREVKTFREFLYVTTEAVHGLDIVDMRNPDAPTLVRTWRDTFTTAHTLCIDEARGLLFANGTNAGLRVLSLLPDPAEPYEVGFFGDYYVHDCVVRGTTLYASAILDGFLAMLDVSDPSQIREVTRFTTGRAFTHNSWPTVDGNYLFTTDERLGAPLEGWDIRDPFAPVKVSEYIGAPNTIPHNVMVDGTRLLVAHYTEGVHLLDIADPTKPRLLGRYDTLPGPSSNPRGFDGAWGAYIFPGSDLIVASDMTGGLFVVSYTGG